MLVCGAPRRFPLNTGALAAPVPDGTHVVREPPATYGFKAFPAAGQIVTNEKIEQLRDELAI